MIKVLLVIAVMLCEGIIGVLLVPAYLFGWFCWFLGIGKPKLVRGTDDDETFGVLFVPSSIFESWLIQ